ncbi:MAG: CHAP domain-containing protein, partial [Dehalococcoidia bacterium]
MQSVHQAPRPHRLLLAVGRPAAALLFIAAVSATAGPAPAEASGTHWCECVEYVKNFYRLQGAAGNAKDMGPFLAKHGFRRTNVPAPGEVVILQPSFYKSGAGAIYGHAAIIESIA